MSRARSVLCLAAWIAGAGATLAFAAGLSLTTLVVGVLLVLLGAALVRARSAALGGAVTALAAALICVFEAGPFTAVSSAEWLYVALATLTWAVVAALVAVIAGRKSGWGFVSAVLLMPIALLAVAGIRNYITPVVRTTAFIPMPDGVRLAASVYLPRGLASDERVPTVLVQTRYHRSQDLRLPANLLLGPGPTASPLVQPLVRRRFAYVLIDVRGTGASFGVTPGPLASRERADGLAVLHWVVNQRWSNGRVGGEGVSYNGSAGELLLGQGDPAFRALVPMFSLYDGYAEILFPGGIFAEPFMQTWSRYGQALDRNRGQQLLPGVLPRLIEGVTPVQGDRAALAAALREHAANPDVLQLARKLEFREDRVGDFAAPTTAPFQDTIRASHAPIFSISGWYDGGYPNAAIRRFLTTATPGSRLLIGPWTHGGRQVDRKCRTDASPLFRPAQAIADFFAEPLQGTKSASASGPPVQYYTLCAEQWRFEATWPPPATPLRLYLGDARGLLESAPPEASGSDRYRVDLTATSGSRSRWTSYVNLAGVRIGYPDRAQQDRKLLTYDSRPLPRDTEMTGHPLVVLYLASSAPDGQLFAYLEDIDPAGDVEYVTEGQLRLIHRRVSSAAPYRTPSLYRSFSRAAAAPMIPGESAEIVLDLLPTSYLFRRGHRVRLAIAGADRDNFVAPAGPAADLTIFRDVARPSRIELPVVDRDVE